MPINIPVYLKSYKVWLCILISISIIYYIKYDKLYFMNHQQHKWSNHSSHSYADKKLSINEECLAPYKENYNIEFGSFVPKQSTFKQPIYDLMINPASTVCGSGPIFILLLMLTNPIHFALRQKFRNSFGANLVHGNSHVRHIFLVGNVTDSKMQQMLLVESQRYNDILQSTVSDSYFNLTELVITGFKWVFDYCPQAKYVIKMDDDQYVDIVQVILYFRKFEHENGNFIRENWDILKPDSQLFSDSSYYQANAEPRESFDYVLEDSKITTELLQRYNNRINVTTRLKDTCNMKNFNMFNIDERLHKTYLKRINQYHKNYIGDLIFCPVKINDKPVRDPHMKYYISEKEFASPLFPPYCLGWFYAIPTPLVFKLYHAFLIRPDMYLEDVLITGILSQVPGALIINIFNRVQTGVNPFQQWLNPSVMGIDLEKYTF